MSRTWSLVAAAAAVSLLVAGCARGDPDGALAAPPVEPEPVDQGSGRVAVEVGEPFEVTDEFGVPVMTVAFTDVEVDMNCRAGRAFSSDGTEPRPINGQFVGVKADVTTTAAYEPELHHSTVTDSLRPGDFQVVDADGFMVGDLSGMFASCLEGRPELGDLMVTDASYRGWVLLDAPVTDGPLLFIPRFAVHLPGWELDLPAGEVTSASATPAAGDGIEESDGLGAACAAGTASEEECFGPPGGADAPPAAPSGLPEVCRPGPYDAARAAACDEWFQGQLDAAVAEQDAVIAEQCEDPDIAAYLGPETCG